jgi:hypothetical protein
MFHVKLSFGKYYTTFETNHTMWNLDFGV